MITARLDNYRQSPRKVRVVANIVKGKAVVSAISELSLLAKRSASPLLKLIESAVANAKNTVQAEAKDLFVKELRVDKGVVLKRMMPKARGSGARINKRSSHVLVVLDLMSNNPRFARKIAKKAKAASKI